jgi:tetrahydromethanopterin S-methyltransferase subunit G
MSRVWLAAPLLFAVLAATPAPTPASTQDLTAGPPSGAWQVYEQGTGPRTAADLWGAKASTVKGFVDAYERSWNQTNQGLVDRLEHFTSVFWAAFRWSESHTADQRDSRHSSVKRLTPFRGAEVYEATDPVDAQGYLTDTIVFAYGDYVGGISIAAAGSIPRATLLDQLDRQLNLLPLPVAEYQAIGNGIFTGVAIVFGAVVGIVILVVVVVVLAIVLSRRRRPAAAGGYAAIGAAGGGLQFSADRRYWWDGQAWQEAATRMPPGVQISPDRAYWWDGAIWRPVPRA